MRAESRIFAFKMIFSTLFQTDLEDAKENFAKDCTGVDTTFVESVLDAFTKNKASLETQLKGVLENYEIDRIYKVDLALIYLAMTEIYYIKTPKPVVVNEVVEIAKKFSTEKSSKFINGVLAKIN